ncbi:MAG: putative DNA binding domain-containing protein [Candidatus Thermoplasmatota archaeon]|nr:putative DNA binding domain-containing protein [Candidatus Thermoplasmatota archaeon]MBU4256774.1 putative DNA binding domain-containing protein [Candidatus Thermoplasmatota archaeon]
MKFKESDATELKKSLSQLDDALKSVCGFLNYKGGVVYFGVGDDGEVIGLQVSDKTLRKISQQVHSRIKPEFTPEIKEVKEKGKSIIQVKVPEGSNKPYFLNGIAYRKVGSEKRIIPPDELKRIILEQKKTRWDEEVCKGATLKDIDDEKVKWFLRKAKFERRLDIDPTISVKDALKRLELIRNNKLTNAAVLLFGKNPQRFFLQSEVRCARFKGTKPVKPFIDMKVFSGNIIDQVDKSLSFVLEHISMKVYLTGKPEREEKYEYPADAIREAIINAVCHRDYETSTNIQIRIFDDRIEVWSCGSLPEPLTLEDLRKKHRSILRNPLIGKCFFLMKFIEQWGTGTNDMIDMCLDWDIPEPLFEYVTCDFVITFRKSKLTEEYLEKLGLNERQKKAVEYLLKHKKITNREYRQLNSNITDRTVLNDLNELISKDIVIAKGERKFRYYILR